MTTPDPLDDFRNVLYLVWRQIIGCDPTWVQYDMGDYLQNGPRRKIIEGYRGVGKSWIAATYAVDQLRLDPTMNNLVISASKARADEFSTFALRLISEMEIFQHLRPRWERASKIAFDVGPAPISQSPSMKSLGITSQVTGSRANLIIADDVEVVNNSATQMMREKLKERIKEFDSVLKPGGKVVFLGTPQTEQSIYNDLPGRGYEKRIWPARYPTPEQLAALGEYLAPAVRARVEANPELAGTPCDPDRFTEMDLQERELSLGRSTFAMQFMLDTSASDANRYPLKLSDLVVMDLDVDLAPEKVVWARSPELAWNELDNPGFDGDRFYRPMATKGLAPFAGSVLAIDPAGRGKDETAFAVVKALNSQLFVPECTGIEGGYSEAALTRLAHVAKANKVSRVVYEANFGDGMFGELFKPILASIYPCTVEEVKHSIQKEKRIIDVLEPVMNQHRLIFGRKVVENDAADLTHRGSERAVLYRLFYQMTRITRERGALAQDDRLDALAIGVNFWVMAMAQNIERQMVERRASMADRDLEDFMENVMGQRHVPKTWMSNGLHNR